MYHCVGKTLVKSPNSGHGAGDAAAEFRLRDTGSALNSSALPDLDRRGKEDHVVIPNRPHLKPSQLESSFGRATLHGRDVDERDKRENMTMALSVTPLTPAVGAEISGVDLASLTDPEFSQIKEAWYRYSALLVREQDLTDDDLLNFSRKFGVLDPPPNQEHGRQSPPGYPDVYVVSNVLDEKGQPIGALGAGEAVWHTDMSYLECPPDASMLYALEVPPEGGNTWICGMQAAWASLPESLKAKVRNLRIKHDGTYNSGGFVRKGVTPTDDPHKAPGSWHPAVCRHPVTGVPSLYLGRRRNSYVEGLSPADSDALLDQLWSHMENPEFHYEHRWRVGDLLLWDNRSTMHRRDPFDNNSRRVMHRTQIKGEIQPAAYFAAA